jgi:hypothetical protein
MVWNLFQTVSTAEGKLPTLVLYTAQGNKDTRCFLSQQKLPTADDGTAGTIQLRDSIIIQITKSCVFVLFCNATDAAAYLQLDAI